MMTSIAACRGASGVKNWLLWPDVLSRRDIERVRTFDVAAAAAGGLSSSQKSAARRLVGLEGIAAKMSGTIAIYLCASLLVLTAPVHSILGEMRLISPLLAQREGVLKSELARFLLRAVWHFMSVAFAIIAVGLVASMGPQGSARTALLVATAVASAVTVCTTRSAAADGISDGHCWC